MRRILAILLLALRFFADARGRGSRQGRTSLRSITGAPTARTMKALQVKQARSRKSG